MEEAYYLVAFCFYMAETPTLITHLYREFPSKDRIISDIAKELQVDGLTEEEIAAPFKEYMKVMPSQEGVDHASKTQQKLFYPLNGAFITIAREPVID